MLDIKLEKQLPVVQMNFEEVKASLIAGAEKYRGIVVTEESLKDCKVMQKELSKTKNSLDTYRKGIKKEMLIPVTAFENQCKELIGLVAEVESPIKDAITVFDDETREKKKLVAQSHVDKAIIDHLLNDKYGSQLIVQAEYLNVSMSIKKVKEDIEKRALLLQQEQQQESDNLQIIKDTIENANKSIDAKLDIQDFQNLINTDVPISQVLSTIHDRAERTQTNEINAATEKAARAEKEVLERIAKAEREAAEKTRIEERNIQIAKEAAEDTERLRLKAIEDIATAAKNKAIDKLEQEAKLKELTRNINIGTNSTEEKEVTQREPQPNEKLYFIEMRVEGTRQEVADLSQFLKTNDYNYKATDKGVLI